MGGRGRDDSCHSSKTMQLRKGKERFFTVIDMVSRNNSISVKKIFLILVYQNNFKNHKTKNLYRISMPTIFRTCIIP